MKIRLFARLSLFALLALAACQTLPSTRLDRLPVTPVIADGSGERAAMNARVYDVATDLVERRFYDPQFGGIAWRAEVDAARAEAVAQPDEAGFYHALGAILSRLDDRHTSALAPSVNRAVQERRLESIPRFGLDIVKAGGPDEGFYVTRVVAASPAEAAGVRPGWRVISVDGAPYPQAGAAGLTTRSWVFSDAEGAERRVDMAAVPMARELAVVVRRPDGVLWVRFDEFDVATRRYLLDRLKTEFADPPRAVVVDLRLNRGGVDVEVGRLLSPFFAESRLFAVEDIRHFLDRRLRTRPGSVRFNGPLAVLTSGSSASGAEVFAAAVQEAGRGPIVGARTLGAVVASQLFDLPDGGRLSVGVLALLTGGGVRLEHVGVVPDLPVEATIEDLKQGRDAVLEAAVAALMAPAATPVP